MKTLDLTLTACAVVALAFGGLSSSNAFGVAAASCNKKKCKSDNEANTFACQSSDGTGSCPSVQIVASNQHCTDGGSWDDCTETYDANAIHYTSYTYGSVAQVTTWTAHCRHANGAGASFSSTISSADLSAQISAGGYTSAECTFSSATTCNCTGSTPTNHNGRTKC